MAIYARDPWRHTSQLWYSGKFSHTKNEGMYAICMTEFTKKGHMLTRPVHIGLKFVWVYIYI